MRVWRIVPVTPASDPRWQDHRIWREVLVRAESAAMARLLASELESGGRMIDAILTNTMLPHISREFLTRLMQGTPVERVQVKVREGEFDYAFS